MVQRGWSEGVVLRGWSSDDRRFDFTMLSAGDMTADTNPAGREQLSSSSSVVDDEDEDGDWISEYELLDATVAALRATMKTGSAEDSSFTGGSSLHSGPAEQLPLGILRDLV